MSTKICSFAASRFFTANLTTRRDRVAATHADSRRPRAKGAAGILGADESPAGHAGYRPRRNRVEISATRRHWRDPGEAEHSCDGGITFRMREGVRAGEEDGRYVRGEPRGAGAANWVSQDCRRGVGF
jgi:hypothetical protein